MSVQCRVAHPTLLLKALGSIHVHRDCWATVTFASSAVVLHVDGSDLVCTATAVLPRNVFADYAVTGEPRFAVHVANLIDALLLLGAEALVTPTASVALAYSTDHAKLLVDVADMAVVGTASAGAAAGSTNSNHNHHNASHGGARAALSRVDGDGFVTALATAAGGGCGGSNNGSSPVLGAQSRRTLRSTLLTRPAMRTVLDLHFDEVPLCAQATLHGEALRDVIADVVAAQCTRTMLTLAPAVGVHVRGEGGPYGSMDVLLQRHCDAVLSMSADNSNANNEGNDGDVATGLVTARDDVAATTTTMATAAAAAVAVGVCAGHTCVSTSHLAAACGARLSALPANRVTRSTAVSILAAGVDAFFGFAGNAATSATRARLDGGGGGNVVGLPPVASALFDGVEQLTLQVNARQQLSVVSVQQKHDVRVTVTVVLMPLVQ